MIPGPDHADRRWLTAALTASGAAPPDAQVAGVTTEAVGTGRLSRAVRFRLRWAGGRPPGAPASVIGKFAATATLSRRTGIGSGAYAREVGFYRDLSGLVPDRVPRCHAAALDPATGSFALLVEDVAGRSLDQIEGCSADQAASALTTLAQLHATFWAAPLLRSLAWLPRRGDDRGRGAGAAYRLLWTRFVERLGSRLSAPTLAAIERFDPLVRRWACGDGLAPTLGHGDFRADNLMFAPGRVTVLDWQTTVAGPGPADAAYLVGGSVPTRVRRAAEPDLLAHYRDRLAAAGIRLGAGECERAYRWDTLAGLHMTVVAALLVESGGHGDDLFMTMAERHAEHVADWDALELVRSAR